MIIDRRQSPNDQGSATTSGAEDDRRSVKGQSALKYHNARMFVAGQGLSNIGTFSQMVALSLLVLQLTDSGLALGVVIEALMIRVQLAVPGNTFLDPGAYNAVFTMHGTTMIFLVVMPLLLGFANYFVPLQIGAVDMAFPRINAMSYWLLLFGGLILYFGFVAGTPPDTGWFSYAPEARRAAGGTARGTGTHPRGAGEPSRCRRPSSDSASPRPKRWRRCSRNSSGTSPCCECRLATRCAGRRPS